MFDLAVVAKGFAQEMAGVSFVALAEVGGVDVHSGYISTMNNTPRQDSYQYNSGYI
jgi:hypothetical protein